MRSVVAAASRAKIFQTQPLDFGVAWTIFARGSIATVSPKFARPSREYLKRPRHRRKSPRRFTVDTCSESSLANGRRGVDRRHACIMPRPISSLLHARYTFDTSIYARAHKYAKSRAWCRAGAQCNGQFRSLIWPRLIAHVLIGHSTLTRTTESPAFVGKCIK